MGELAFALQPCDISDRMITPGDGRLVGGGEGNSSAFEGFRWRMSEIQPASCLCMSCSARFSVAKCGRGCPASILQIGTIHVRLSAHVASQDDEKHAKHCKMT